MEHDWRDTVETHRARYRERIIDAAIGLVAEEGVSKASMAALAQRAGIGRATVYKYFPDVEHALLAHAEREVDECWSRLHRALETHADPVDRLRACVSTLLDYFSSQRHRLGWVTLEQADLSSAATATLRGRMGRLPEPIVATVADGVRTGAFRPDVKPELHGLLIFKIVVSMHDHLVAGHLTAEAAAETVWQLLTHGILSPVNPQPNGRH